VSDGTRSPIEFDERLKQLTPRVWAMPLMMAICVGLWIANVASGMSAMSPGADDLYRWGGSSASGVQSGQWWRLVTAMFLHGGVIHLALNMYALWEAGLMVTRLFGNRGFLLVYLGAGLVGGGLSLHFSGQTNVSVGASGAVFGIIGALLAAVIEHRGHFPGGRGKQLIGSLAFFILYSLAYGFSQSNIDNAAHVGGLLGGLVAGWLLVEKIDTGPSMNQRAMRFALALALLGGSATALALAAPKAQRNISSFYQGLKDWKEAEAAMSKAFRAVEEDGKAFNDRSIDVGTFLSRLQDVHIPALKVIEGRFDALGLPQDDRSGQFSSAQKRFVGAYREVLEAEAKRFREPGPATEAQLEAGKKKMKDIRAEIDVLNAPAKK
jgi:rhomboid protease GluP